MNLRYFLKLYFKDPVKFKLGKSKWIQMGDKRKKAFNISVKIQDEIMDGYAVLNGKCNGFTLFFPKKEVAITYKVYRTEKFGNRAKVEIFKRQNSRNCFDLRNYLKTKKQHAWL